MYIIYRTLNIFKNYNIKNYKQRLTNSCHRKINASLALRMGLELIYANI